MKKFAIACALIVVISGCGSGGGGGKDYASGAELAKAAGCGAYRADDQTQMYAQESGSCQIDGKDVYVDTFADTAARDNWMKVAKTMGASGYFGQGAKWVIQSDDKAAVQKGTKAAGGSMT